MRCPSCLGQMSPLKMEDSEVQYCRHCYGVWLEKGELAHLQKQTSDLHPESEPTFKTTTHRTSSGRFWKRNCPHCNIPLHQYKYVKRYPIYIDVCPDCKGIFLDKGEYVEISSLYQKGKNLTVSGSPRIEEIADYYNQDPDRDLEVKDWLFQFFTGLPVEVNVPATKTPYMNYIFLLTNVLIWGFMLFFSFKLNSSWIESAHYYENIFKTYGLIPADFLAGRHRFTIFTSMFLHLSIMHLIGNMYFLYIMGDNVEDYLGHIGYFFFYLIAGIFADFVYMISNPGSTIPCVGASGAISGVIGAYLIACPKAKITFMFFFVQFKLPAYVYLIFWFILQLVCSMAKVGGVAWAAHIGGFLFGVIVFGILRVSVFKTKQEKHGIV